MSAGIIVLGWILTSAILGFGSCIFGEVFRASDFSEMFGFGCLVTGLPHAGFAFFVVLLIV